MNKKRNSYYSFRLKLEKLKQKTWLLIVLAKLLYMVAAINAAPYFLALFVN